MPRFCCMIEVQGWPLPEGIERRYHYFRNRDRALRFAGKVDATIRYQDLCDGYSLMQPIVMARLLHDGKIYETISGFPYEMEEDEVRKQWADPDGFGCDCQRCQVIAQNGGTVSEMPCGDKIKLLDLSISFESDPEQFVLH